MAGVYQGHASQPHLHLQPQKQATTHIRVENGQHVTNVYQTTQFNYCTFLAAQMNFQPQIQPPLPQTTGMDSRFEPQPGLGQPTYLDQPKTLRTSWRQANPRRRRSTRDREPSILMRERHQHIHAPT